jgi:hypothetical protein
MRATWARVTLAAFFALALLMAAGAACGQTAISEVTVIYGGSSGIQPPAGWVKVPWDLNRNAGGDYIYVCYKRGIGAPITGLYVTIGSGHPAVPEKCTMIPVDLNRNAGGDYIYLWTTKDPDCAVVNDITVVDGKNAQAPAGYTKINIDLNRNAGGDYMYLCYRKQ